MRRTGKGYRLGAGAALAALAVVEAATVSAPEMRRSVDLVVSRAREEPIPAARRTGFFFDTDYESFLTEVARRTPEDATVAVLVPERPDVYRYQAAYVLAPRRVVDEPRAAEARWLAAWRRPPPAISGGLRIGGEGWLIPSPR